MSNDVFFLRKPFKIKPKVRIFFLQVAFLCLPCFQSGSESPTWDLKSPGSSDPAHFLILLPWDRSLWTSVEEEIAACLSEIVLVAEERQRFKWTQRLGGLKSCVRQIHQV